MHCPPPSSKHSELSSINKRFISAEEQGSTGEQLVQLIFMLIYFLLWELQSNSIAAAAHSLEATKRHS